MTSDSTRCCFGTALRPILKGRRNLRPTPGKYGSVFFSRLSVAVGSVCKSLCASLLLLLTLWGGRAVGQDYASGTLDEGFYLIFSDRDPSYYLCPAKDPANPSSGQWFNGNSAMPLITTNKNVPTDYALWLLAEGSDGYYQFIHAKEGLCVVNNATSGDRAVHLEASPADGDNVWFSVSYVSGYYNIKRRNMSAAVSWNPYGNNKDNYNGSSGMIGYYDGGDVGSRWRFVEVSLMPEIDGSGTNVAIALPLDIAATIYYTIDGSDPRSSASRVEYAGVFTVPDGTPVVKAAFAVKGHFSDVAMYALPQTVGSTNAIVDMEGKYLLAPGFEVNGSIGTASNPFRGTIDGQFNTIASLSVPLVAYADGAVVRNVIVGNAAITGGASVGAICGEAVGATRIYNCGILDGSVGGTGYVGGIAGRIDGQSRVINCFSFADVTGGSVVGGIVGYNGVASSTANIATMVMNCMFYGNAVGGNVAPIYNGQIINNNSSTGLNNFNYYSFEDFSSDIDTYNCALGAERRYLVRFEFYRHILNSNRELAAWYATGSTENARTVMAKWVLDKSVAPYPILKPQGKYPSVINFDASSGEQLGTLAVTIGGVGSNAPSGASIATGSLVLRRTGKDTANFNYNYDKVQLPYYNDIGTGNYTHNRVVVGWKITAIVGGTAGSFVAADATGGYNYADRGCTQKDLYSVGGRIFSQGACFDVPTGVTAITIEPHWANAVYLSDPAYDKTYTKTYANANYNITAMGTRYVNNANYTINGSSQKVYTTMSGAITALNLPDGSSVYDYAVVLVGNYHHYYGNSTISDDTKGFTIMSADLDWDNEPDNCFIFQMGEMRQPVTPIRFDFLCWPGIGMAQKPSDSPRMPGIGIFKPRGWFEVTSTCIARFTELEYAWDGKNADAGGSPLILLGGIYEQFTSSNGGAPLNTKYIIVGCNAWFKMFNNGVHADIANFTPHIPISVLGGDYDEFYLSGMFRPDAAADADNAECYISGGRFGELAGAGQEQINGNVYWQINYADIGNFYGGGINDAKPVTGNITVEIMNSNVGTYCGGPKFGNMSAGKVVETTADNCTFGSFFGAGYGGTSFNRVRKRNYTNLPNYNFSAWALNEGRGYSRKYEATTVLGGVGDASSNITVNAIATNYEYELFAYAGFADNNNVGRFYVNYASLSLAVTRSVTSTLTGCTVLENFYGGGNLGKVEGNVTSTLTDCLVLGNAYGAGFSATAPTVDVMAKAGFAVEPHYDGNSGTYTQGVFPDETTYTWTHTDAPVAAGSEFDEVNHLIYTNVEMTTLGTVTGKATLTITGNSVIGTSSGSGTLVGTGNVFGGGEESKVGSTEVRILGHTNVLSNVYGGGDLGEVLGDTKVIVNGAEM